MPLPDSIADAVERFDANRSEYHKGHFNETQTRVDYVNPLFAALGWDMGNLDGLSELLREVVHEDAIKIGGTMKAPDYSFRVGGARKFFVETKKPSVNLYLLEAPAFQLRRYAWTVKMPLSILTNFEEFAIYDTRVPPDKKDAAKTARLEYFKYTDFAEKWDTIAARFSRDAVLSGAFDQYAEQARGNRISVPVDVAFLTEISGWRVKLARNIVQNNPNISPRELNYAVQMIIDRIIFLRISEDRGAERDYLLQPLMNKGGPVYPRLLDIFHRADARYNSGLFHFKAEARRESPDDVTPQLKIDDRPLQEIIASVYYPESPFEFSVFPADILGQVYEQFLGKVIHVSGRTAEVEYKPEVQKAGGVYYTPTYIVNYIVHNTVGRLVEGKNPAQVANLTILDPACGSGSFLIGAYQFLLDWHLRYYTENDRTKWSKGKNATIYQIKKDFEGGEIWRLTTAERKRILIANIYGVDIDTQAVEVTKLSLLLKVLEGESAELIDNTLKLLQERALPDLEHNIKCGNSLIGPDFYTDKDLALFDLDSQLRINTFSWGSAFPKIMADSGFDAVIGNPPYGIIFDEGLKPYLEQHYVSFTRNNDNYAAFSQKAVAMLKPNGLMGFIIPNTFLLGPYFDGLKRNILLNAVVERVVDFGLIQVFPKPNVFTSLIFLKRKPKTASEPQGVAEYTKVSDLSKFPNALIFGNLEAKALDSLRWSLADVFASKLLSSFTALDEVAWVKDVGLNHWTEGRGKKRGGSISDRVFYDGDREHSNDLSFYKGRDVERYNLLSPTHWMRHNWAEKLDPTIDTLRFSQEFLALDKIIYRQTADRITASYEPNGQLIDKTVHMIALKSNQQPLSLMYLLGLLNSRLTTLVYRYLAQEEGRTFAQVKIFRVKQLPIRLIDFSKLAEKAKHDKMVSLVEQMLKLHKDKAGARLGQEKAVLQQQIEATDAQIDRLVYDLYGLTEAEIKIVEAAG